MILSSAVGPGAKTSSRHDAEDDVEAEVDGSERLEDAGLLCAGREVYDFLWIHVRFNRYSPKNWTSLSWHRSSAKAGATHLWGNTRNDRTENDTTSLDPVTIVTKLNRTMCGWANYFCLGPVSTAYRAVDGYATMRLRQWLRTQTQALRTCKLGCFPDTHLYGALGACSSGQTDTQLSVGRESVSASPRAGCGRSACPVR